MKRYAVAQGVPADAIVEEPKAQDTIQNIYYSNQIMQAQGWHSAEVVSSRSHLPRAGLILHNYHFAWHAHGAPWPNEYHFYKVLAIYAAEIDHCWQIRKKGFPANAMFPPA
jgi:vancomycin permeability regulator SanA